MYFFSIACLLLGLYNLASGVFAMVSPAKWLRSRWVQKRGVVPERMQQGGFDRQIRLTGAVTGIVGAGFVIAACFMAFGPPMPVSSRPSAMDASPGDHLLKGLIIVAVVWLISAGFLACGLFMLISPVGWFNVRWLTPISVYRSDVESPSGRLKIRIGGAFFALSGLAMAVGAAMFTVRVFGG